MYCYLLYIYMLGCVLCVCGYHLSRPQSHTHKTQGRSISQGQGNKLWVLDWESQQSRNNVRMTQTEVSCRSLWNGGNGESKKIWPPLDVTLHCIKAVAITIDSLSLQAVKHFHAHSDVNFFCAFTFYLPMYTYLDQVKKSFYCQVCFA